MLAPRGQPSFMRVIVILAATVIVLAGIYLASPVLVPVLFALVLALIVAPLYRRLIQRRLPTWLALLIMVVGLVTLFGLLYFLFVVSISAFSSSVTSYSTELDDKIAQFHAWLGQSEFANQLSSLFNGSAIIGLIGSLLQGVISILGSTVYILILILLFLSGGQNMVKRLRESQGADHPQVQRLTSFARRVSTQFALRGVVNLFTGASFSIFLLLVGVDYALLWGVLTFFLSYIPYLGIVLAGAPAVILALAEFGLPQALLVVLGLTVINLSAENILQPNLMGRGLNISPAFVFLGFMLWTWLLGGAGAFLAMPMTIMIVLALDAFPETRWLADAVTNEGRVVKSGAVLPKAGELKAED